MRVPAYIHAPVTPYTSIIAREREHKQDETES